MCQARYGVGIECMRKPGSGEFGLAPFKVGWSLLTERQASLVEVASLGGLLLEVCLQLELFVERIGEANGGRTARAAMPRGD